MAEQQSQQQQQGRKDQGRRRDGGGGPRRHEEDDNQQQHHHQQQQQVWSPTHFLVSFVVVDSIEEGASYETQYVREIDEGLREELSFIR